MHVHEVGDERRHEAAVVEGGARDTRLAVMQGAHTVEAMRREARPRIGRGAGGVVRRGRVPERDDDAALGERARCREAGIGLGCERHEPNELAEAIAKPDEPVEIDGTHEVDRVRAGRASEERAFEMHPHDGVGPRPLRDGEPLEHRVVRVERRGADRRQQRRAPRGDDRVDRVDDLADSSRSRSRRHRRR